MAYKTFTNGSVLTDSDLNTYLMKQAVIVCTAGTRPASPPEGMTIYQTDDDTLRIYNGTAWQVIGWTNYPTTWTAVGFSSGYSAYTNFPPRARFVNPGRVELRGSIQKNSGAFTSGTVIATLPNSTYWPQYTIPFVCGSSVDSSAGWSIRIDIYTNGNIVPFFAQVGGSFQPTWVDLAGIEYDLV